MDNSGDIVSGIVQRTSSELVLFFVIFLVALILFFLPFYRMISKDRIQRQMHDKELIRDIMQVITANSEVISKNVVLLKEMGKTQSQNFSSLHEKLNSILISLEKLMTQGKRRFFG